MSKKIASNQEQIRTRIFNFYQNHRSKGKSYTIHHFQQENISKSTIYRAIKNVEQGKSPKRIVGSDAIAKKMTKSNIRQLTKMINHKDSVSTRQAAKKFNCHHTLIVKTLKKYTDIRYKKKVQIPKRNERQQSEAKRKCGVLLKKYINFDWIIDDESYFTLSNSTINGNNGFYSNDLDKTPSDVKFKRQQKYEQKILLWLCISNQRISKPFFAESGLAINQDVYLNKCIKPKVVPFIKKYHKDKDYIFWPDLATSHYSNSVTEFLRKQNIHFVQKEDNPACLPECRPIEDFWSILKGQVYKGNWQANTVESLQDRIKMCLKKIDVNLVKKLVESIPLRLMKVHKEGVIENQKQ